MLELVRSGSVDHLRYCAGLSLLAGSGGEGVRVLGAEDPLDDRQRGVLIRGPCRIPRPGPGGLGLLGVPFPGFCDKFQAAAPSRALVT
jgi:hypothetical protein